MASHRRALLAITLCAAAALSGCSEGSSSAEVIAIKVNHSRFSPGTLRVEAGTTITFVVENDDPIDHELIIGDQAVQDRHEKGTEPEHGARPGEITVPAEETRSTTYTFTEPGRLIYGCHLPGHYDYGMRGTIEVL